MWVWQGSWVMAPQQALDHLDQFLDDLRERGVLVTLLATVRVLLAGLVPAIEIVTARLKLLQSAIEFSREYDRPVGTCLSVALRGHDPKYYFLHDLEGESTEAYVSRASARYAGKRDDGPVKNVNKNSRHVLNDKLAIYDIFEDIEAHFPVIYGTIHDGQYFRRDGDRSESVIDVVDRHGKVALKPPDRAQGRGFHVLSNSEGSYAIDDTPASTTDVEQLLDDHLYQNAILMEYVDQHEYAAEIYPDTTNTIRLLTVLDRETGEPHVTRPVHRFGTRESYPVDNFDEGGVLAPIDVETGRMVGIVTLDSAGSRICREDHPETGGQVAGVEIPMWETVIDIAKTGAREYRSARIIGWDIVVGADQPYVLEASGMPSIAIPQVHGGLLEDENLAYHIEQA